MWQREINRRIKNENVHGEVEGGMWGVGGGGGGGVRGGGQEEIQRQNWSTRRREREQMIKMNGGKCERKSEEPGRDRNLKRASGRRRSGGCQSVMLAA